MTPTGSRSPPRRSTAHRSRCFRRAVGFVPYVENVADWLPIPYHFTFQRDGTVLGSHRRHIGKLRDVYTIDLSADAERSVDRRLILAIAVGMDALQAR